MKIIHCNVYGDVEVSSVAIALIDTEPFQRLRNINQTGLAKFVFPGAVTTRFEHSIGTYHLTGVVLTRLSLGVKDPRHELIKLGGLCHDIGHGPYSHMFDTWCMKNHTGRWKHHELRSQDIFRVIAQGVLNSKDIDFVCSVIRPASDDWFMNIVNNSINGLDTDKLDYIVRDNRAFGLHLDIDVNRIVTNMKLINGEVCFCHRIADELVNVYLVRKRLYKKIYTHPAVGRFEKAMFKIMQKFDYEKIAEDRDVSRFCMLTESYVEVMGDQNLVRDLFLRKVRNDTAKRSPGRAGAHEVHEEHVPSVLFSPGITFSRIKLFDRKTLTVSAFDVSQFPECT